MLLRFFYISWCKHFVAAMRFECYNSNKITVCFVLCNVFSRFHICGRTTPQILNLLKDIYSAPTDQWLRGAVQKQTNSIFTYPNWGWPPSLPPYFWQIYFWHNFFWQKSWNFTYILYYSYYFLMVRGTDRKTQSPLVSPDWAINHTK